MRQVLPRVSRQQEGEEEEEEARPRTEGNSRDNKWLPVSRREQVCPPPPPPPPPLLPYPPGNHQEFRTSHRV